ncbi:MAG: SRPBCC family protein [Microthrixaceae bacterium]
MAIESALVIDAPVERVWELTLDIESWPELTPTMTSVERLDDGALRVGSTARVVQPRQRPTVWTVTALEPRSRFVWSTKLATLTMTASHEVEEVGPDRCRNTLRVELDGFGAGLARRLLGSTMRRAITTENEGFRSAAERS